MFIDQLITNFIIFFLGFFTILFNYNTLLITLIGIELMLLSINLNFIIFSIYLDDIFGQICSLFILTIAAAESAIGLAILIIFFKLRFNLLINSESVFRG